MVRCEVREVAKGQVVYDVPGQEKTLGVILCEMEGQSLNGFEQNPKWKNIAFFHVV